jgi:AraC-like DNA-binding protein
MYQAAALQLLEDHYRERDQFIPFLNISNINLPSSDQFSAFRSVYRGVLDISAGLEGERPFPAQQTIWNLDRIAFLHTALPGETLTHRQRHMKDCALDHWYVSLPFRHSDETGGTLPRLHCLGTPSDRVFDHDGMLTLFFPHDLFAPAATLDRMLDAEFEGVLGRLLADYLVLLDRSLAYLRRSEVPHIVEATRSLVVACLAPSQDHLVEARAPIDATLLARARRMIDGRLSDHDLSADKLCAALGVSRSRLYRIFEPFGGIASYVRKQRLLRIREVLSDITDTRSVSRIAEHWGFLDASAFSRTFRREFGMSPKEARDMAWAGNSLISAQQCHSRYEAGHTLYQLLRSLDKY